MQPSFQKMRPSFKPNSYVFSKASLALLIFRKLALDNRQGAGTGFTPARNAPTIHTSDHNILTELL